MRTLLHSCNFMRNYSCSCQTDPAASRESESQTNTSLEAAAQTDEEDRRAAEEAAAKRLNSPSLVSHNCEENSPRNRLGLEHFSRSSSSFAPLPSSSWKSMPP